MWNANHWQQWNFQPNWANPLVAHGQPPPPPPPVNAPLPPPHQAPPPPPPEDVPFQGTSMTDAEKNFDQEFIEWEKKFLKWKEENKNHPDKKALAEYEAQWQGWRQHLLQDREHFRKQQEDSINQFHIPNLFATNSAGHSVTSHLSQFSQVPDKFQLKNAGFQQPQKDSSQIPSLHYSKPVHNEQLAGLQDHPSHSVAVAKQRMDNIPQNLRNESHTDAVQSGANLFRSRANRGHSHDSGVSISNRYAPYNVPPRRDPEEIRPEPDSFNIAKEDLMESNRATVMDPIIYEYHHQPSQYGQYSAFENQLKCFDYSHGSRNQTKERRPDNKEVMLTSEQPQSAAKPLVEKPKECQPAKPTQLFPSAASIELNSTSALKPCFPISTNENLEVATAAQSNAPIEPVKVATPIDTVMVEDLLLPPGRYGRPSNIVVIIRGLPGSGKSHLARLIKEKEVLQGGSAPRILSIDDYYLTEDTVPVWNEEQESQYKLNLLKSLKRNLEDGHFSFIIVDTLNLKASDVMDLAEPARFRGFAVFLVDLPDKAATGTTRNCTIADIEKMKSEWEEAPAILPRLNIRWLLQETNHGGERSSTPEDAVTSTTALLDEDSQESSSATPAVSKWELMEQTGEKLDRLDGIVKRKLEKPASLEDWLQLPDDYDQREFTDGKKRVRWADVEEKIQQRKMRDVGFVVGHTDWSRMTDPTFGESALTKTKYI